MNKNKILCLCSVVAVAAILTGCDDYEDRYITEYSSVVRLSEFGEQNVTVWSTDTYGSYRVKVLRSGHDISTPTKAVLKVMSDEEWSSYANTYGLQRYYKLPSGCFRFDSAPESESVALDFAGNQISTTTTLSLYSDKVGAYIGTLPPPIHEGSEWANVICLPLSLESEESTIYNERKAVLLLVRYQQPRLVLSPAGFVKEFCTGSHAAYERGYTLSLPGENKWGFTVKVKNDEGLLERYNQTQGTSYTLMQPGTLEVNPGDGWKEWSDLTLDFPAGTNQVSFKVRINPDKAAPMDAMALTVSEPTLGLKLSPAETTAIFAIAVKPSGIRLKATATHSDYDGTHPAKNLVDGRTDTYYQSQMTLHDGDAVYGSYVDFRLPKSIRYFSIDYISRVSGFLQSSVPEDVNLYVSSDGSDWSLCGTIDGMQSAVSRPGQTVSYGNYDAGRPVCYIRWSVVKGGDKGTDDFRGRAITANWSATMINIYGK